MFMAFAAARRDGLGECALRHAGQDWRLLIRPAGQDRYLLTLPDAEETTQSPPLNQAASSVELDVFAASAPFGAALIEGADPFEGVVVEANSALAAIVGAAMGALHGRRAIPERWVADLLGRTAADDDGRLFELLTMAGERFGYGVSDALRERLALREIEPLTQKGAT